MFLLVLDTYPDHMESIRKIRFKFASSSHVHFAVVTIVIVVVVVVVVYFPRAWPPAWQKQLPDTTTSLGSGTWEWYDSRIRPQHILDQLCTVVVCYHCVVAAIMRCVMYVCLRMRASRCGVLRARGSGEHRAPTSGLTRT